MINPEKGLALSFPTGGALVVGAGNVGGAVVRKLAAAGIPVVFTYAGNEARARVLETESASSGGSVVGRRLDLVDGMAVTRIIEETAERFGRLHTVVYCAGPTIPFLTVRETPPERLEAHLQADTLGCYRLFHHAIPWLQRGGGGSLIACVTMANHRVIETDGLSAIPKAAVESLVRQIAAEEGGSGIRANSVAIGWIGGFASSFDDARAYTAGMPGPEGEATRALIERLISFIRLRRPGRGEEAADIVAYLASNQSSYVTGCTIPADGGAML